MAEYFEIGGTHIPFSAIKDFRVIKVEFVFRPVFSESKKAVMSVFSTKAGKKYEFSHMEPYAAIIGQQGHKSELGEYKPKDFKEALGKDLSSGILYTLADKLKLKAFKREKFQCVNLAGRAFTAYLDDIPAKMIWSDGRIAEVYKEDQLYAVLNEITMPGVEYINALVIKAQETFCFYGNGIQISDANFEYARLTHEREEYALGKSKKRIAGNENKVIPTLAAFRLPVKVNLKKEIEEPEKDIVLENI